ncbi:MAG: hypothetical protein Q4D17_09715 [Planctomycetia bacterium]|nr:hypothetical protein [Planctomycetia bacterium]
MALWNPDIPFPKSEEISFPAGIEHQIVENGLTDNYRFLHDCTICVFKNEIFTAWYACPAGEMIGESRIRGRHSSDGGKTWSDQETLVWDEAKENKMGSSDKCVPCLMDIEDFQAEVRWVAEAAGSTFEGFDFVVHTFERTSRNRVCVPGKEAVQAGSERSAKCRKC